MSDNDTLQRFLFEQIGVRGEIIHLDASYRAIINQRNYPKVVRNLLGELLAATVLLSAPLKTSGSLIMQVHGDGPVSLLVAQADYESHVRGLAHWEGEVPEDSFMAALGHGRLVITIDPGQGSERYQGIVELSADSLAASIENYFTQSEQLATFLFLTANETSAVGLLLQVLPHQENQQQTVIWEHLMHLSRTITAEELLELPNSEILRRLYHEEDIRLFDSEPISFRCGCDRNKMEVAIRTLPYQEVLEILKEENTVTATCEFCNHSYQFDAVDVEKIFADATFADISSTKH
jgi:molecular chaperone Hsp33